MDSNENKSTSPIKEENNKDNTTEEKKEDTKVNESNGTIKEEKKGFLGTVFGYFKKSP